MSKIEVNQISSQCGSTLTIGQSGDTVTLACGATQTGFGRTGTVDWDTTAKTASFTAVSGEGYFVNTTSSAFTATLPAGSAGAIVSFADYAATWQTNALTVSPNGTDKIGGVNASVTLSTEGQSVTFVYIDSTQGWINTMDSTSNVRGNPNLVATGGTITTCGDFKIHTFTGPGTFTVTNLSATAAENTVGYMVLAGGGGGRGNTSAGAKAGGGAGGFREGRNVPIDNFTASPLVADAPTNAVTVTAQAYPITVGGGGAGTDAGNGTAGSNSIFSTITSAGGGSGHADPGGSGAGGSYNSSAGTGNTPPVSPPQGNPGGTGLIIGGGETTSGGGGGAGAAGNNGSPSPNDARGGVGGNGIATSITGSSVTRGGGGNGTGESGSSATYNPTPVPGGGGTGNGGNGTANLGGGGAGGGPSSGAGGSGIVIIRYKFQ